MTVLAKKDAAQSWTPAAFGRLASPNGMFALYVVATILLFGSTIVDMAETWTNSSSYHHGFIIAPLSVWLARRIGAPDAPKPAPIALGFVALAAVAWLVGRAASVNLFEQIAVVSMIIAGAGAIYGVARIKAQAFPLALLYLMVPFGASLVPALQQAAAANVMMLLHLIGIDATIDGLVISTSAGRFAIAEGCAGLNFLLASLLISSVFGFLSMTSWRLRTAFVALAAITAVFANILRIFLVIAIAIATGGAVHIAADHLLFGWLLYGLSLIGLIAVGRSLARGERADTWDYPSSQKALADRSSLSGRTALAAIFCLAAAAFYADIVIDHAPATARPSVLPLASAAGWRQIPTAVAFSRDIAAADAGLRVNYQSSGAEVQWSAAYFTHERRGAEIGGVSTLPYDGAAWRRVGHFSLTARAFGADRELAIIVIENDKGARFAATTFYWSGDGIYPNARALKIAQTRQRLIGRGQRGGVVTISTPFSPDGRAAQSIRTFLSDLEPHTAWLARVYTPAER